MNQTEKYDAIIVGGGLTGLTIAYYLNKAGKKVLILEKNERLGGVIHTYSENDFIYETGPNSGIISTIEAVELFEDLSQYCHLEIANKESKARWIWKNGKWHPLPSGLKAGITTELFDLKDKIKLLFEPFVPKGTNPDESVADMVRRRMGESFLNYAVDPFISGIYAGNPNKLITKYALPKLYNLEQNFGSFIGGSFKKHLKHKDPNRKRISREVFSMELGLQNLAKALESSICGATVATSAENVSLEFKGRPYCVSYLVEGEQKQAFAEYVITSTGGYALKDFFGGIDKNEVSEIVNLKYAKVVQAVLGYKKWTGIELKSFGGLVPTIEKKNILGILFISSIFKQRAPEGGALLSVFMGGERRPDIYEMEDSEIEKIVIESIREMLQPKDIKPDLFKIHHYENAIPQYEISSKKRFAQIEAIENKYPGVVLAGNIRNGIGMSDRIAQARQIVDGILSQGRI